MAELPLKVQRLTVRDPELKIAPPSPNGAPLESTRPPNAELFESVQLVTVSVPLLLIAPPSPSERPRCPWARPRVMVRPEMVTGSPWTLKTRDTSPPLILSCRGPGPLISTELRT